MYPHFLNRNQIYSFFILALAQLFAADVSAKQRLPGGGAVAVVVDERLSALRSTPELSGKLVRRLGRGRLVSLRSVKRGSDGVEFVLVKVTTRTQGWIQRAAIVSPLRKDDDRRLLTLILNSSEFDRIARARIFLDHFPRSMLRSRVLLLLAEAADSAASTLTRDATRRLRSTSFSDNAPEFSYYLNFSGLDRYNRQKVRFTFSRATREFRYDGAAWLELVRRFPHSDEAVIARRHLAGERAQ